MEIRNEVVVVVHGSVSIAKIGKVLAGTWNEEVAAKIKSTVKLTSDSVYKSEFQLGVTAVCVITYMAGGYKTLTTFLEYR